jgi:hypothetical protein
MAEGCPHEIGNLHCINQWGIAIKTMHFCSRLTEEVIEWNAEHQNLQNLEIVISKSHNIIRLRDLQSSCNTYYQYLQVLLARGRQSWHLSSLG